MILLTKSKLLVGRLPHCDIVLSERHISGDHCELFMQGGYWYVRDLRSRNGTKVNGVRVVDEARLEPNDVVSFSHLSYEIRYTPGQ